MLLCALFILATLAALTLRFALHGRQTNDHPLCRKCGYDLTGKADLNKLCSECGADISSPKSIRIGGRQPRVGLARFSSTTLCLSVLVFGFLAYYQIKQTRWIEHAPQWWLNREISSESPSQTTAITEFTRRVLAGELQQGEIDLIADRCLAVQADTKNTWTKPWGAFIEAAEHSGKLDQPRWITYAVHSIDMTLVTPGIINRGNGLPFTFQPSCERTCADHFPVWFRWEELSVDNAVITEVPLCPASKTWGIVPMDFDLRDYIRLPLTGGMQIPPVEMSVIKAGHHKLRIALDCKIFAARGTSYAALQENEKPITELAINKERPFDITDAPAARSENQPMLRDFADLILACGSRLQTSAIRINWVCNTHASPGIQLEIFLRGRDNVAHPVVISQTAPNAGPAKYWVGTEFSAGVGYVFGLVPYKTQHDEYEVIIRRASDSPEPSRDEIVLPYKLISN